MKSNKFVATFAAGLVALGAISASAVQPVAPIASPLTISVTTYQQSSTTDEVGVVTFKSKTVTINNADLLVYAASHLGISLPAGAKLAISTTQDSFNGIFPGDVVIVNGSGKILWDLNEFENAVGFCDIEVNFNDAVDQFSEASKTESDSFIGRGSLFFDIGSDETVEVAGQEIFGDFFDCFGSGKFTRFNNGSQLTTGSGSWSGGGEYVSVLGFDTEGGFPEVDTYQAAKATVTVSVANVPWDLAPFHNED